MPEDLVRKTTRYFESINFEEISDRWIDEAIENEFTDVDDNNMSTGILFTENPQHTLLQVAENCQKWADKLTKEALLEESLTGDVSRMPEESLFTVVKDMDISIKQIQGVIYCLTCKAIKSSSDLREKEIGMLAAKWYFNCLRIPGSNAFKIYNANLFRKCVESMVFPNHVETKETTFNWKQFEKLLPTYALVLQSLVPLLGSFHLGNDNSTITFVIQKLSELAASELSKRDLNFNADYLSLADTQIKLSRFQSSIVTVLAYQGFLTLMQTQLNGDMEFIYSTILSQLNHHILHTKIKKAQITAKFYCIRDNAVNFLCHNLESKNELISQLTLTTLKRLCMCVIDRAEFRASVCDSVMKIMYYLSVSDLVKLLQWLLLLVDSADLSHRVFALEMCGPLLASYREVDREGLPENMLVYLTPLPFIFAVLTRCDDVSPGVRTKALSIISNHMTPALKVLKDYLCQSEDPALFNGEMFEEDNVCEFNGDHRSFWNTFKSFKDMLNEIINIFHRRIDDINGNARRATLQALENVITFEKENLSITNLKLFTLASKDHILMMRKQTVQSLTAILEMYPNESLAQEYWLRCVLPLVRDPENTVQAKVLDTLEEIFLHGVMSNDQSKREVAFSLLCKMSTGEFLSFQRYLQISFGLWKRDRKLRTQMAGQLMRFFGCGLDEIIWLYLSIFSNFCELPYNICYLAVEEFEKPHNWDNSSYMNNILKLVAAQITHLNDDILRPIKRTLTKRLEEFAASVETLPIMIENLYKIEKHLNNLDELSEFAKKMIKASEDNLSPFVRRSKTVSSEDMAIKSFTVIKEFCHTFPDHITKNLCVLLKQFVYVDSKSASSKNLTPTLQAHAFAALGKVGLQEESLALDLLPLLAKELLHSKEDRIRNNCVVVLTEWCKRYTSYADQYMPLISTCFKDKRYIIRHQSITLVVGLLQEDYIKCKGCLLYCILSTLVDPKEEIQDLGKFCLLQLLYPKKNSIFSDYLIDSIFVFNHFVPPPSPETAELAKVVKQMDRFALPFAKNMEKRLTIYKFMLRFMDVPGKAFAIKSLCDDILTPIAIETFPLNERTESMINDCFGILLSSEIKLFDSDAAPDLEEDQQEEAVSSELMSRRFLIIQPVLPVVQLLMPTVRNSCSNIFNELLTFVKELLIDFRDRLDDLLRDDKKLLNWITLTLENEAHQQQKEEREAKKRRETLLKQQSQIALQANGTSEDQNVASTSGHNAAISNGHASSENTNGHGPEDSNGQSSENTNGDVGMETGHNSSVVLPKSYRNDPLLCSTPRVVIEPLKEIDISRIAMEVDSDSD